MIISKRKPLIKYIIYVSKALILLSIVLLFCTLIGTLNVYADNGDTIVHVTNTGKCYHREGCRYLKSDNEVTLYEAVKDNKRPCEVCKPPIYDGPPIISEVEDSHKSYTEESAGTSKGATNKGGSSGQKKTNVSNKGSSNAINMAHTEEQDNSIFLGIAWVFGGAIGGLFLVRKFSDFWDSRQEKEKRAQLREKYYSMYVGKNPLEMVSVPEGSFLTNGYPCTEGNARKPYGKYTVYVGDSRAVLHFSCNCGGAKLRPINYYDARNLRHCKRCSMGKQDLPKLEWYIRYLEIVRIKKEYNIP